MLIFFTPTLRLKCFEKKLKCSSKTFLAVVVVTLSISEINPEI